MDMYYISIVSYGYCWHTSRDYMPNYQERIGRYTCIESDLRTEKSGFRLCIKL